MKLLIILLFLQLNIFAIQILMPPIEALVYKVNSLDIEGSPNYFYEIGFDESVRKIFIRIYLREASIENHKERDILAEKILVNFRTIQSKEKIPSLSIMVDFNDKR